MWCSGTERRMRRPTHPRCATRSCRRVGSDFLVTRCPLPYVLSLASNYRPQAKLPVMRLPVMRLRAMRNVIVTGASRGIGLGIARRLASSGYRVIGIARKPPKPPKDFASAARAETGELHFVAFDLGEIRAIARL